MQAVIDMAFKAANSDATVLILGESGTGKSVLARGCTLAALEEGAAFVTVSCPSLSRELLESELFGHVKGAFTGALADTAGKVAAADGGTLLLDEIGDLPDGNTVETAPTCCRSGNMSASARPNRAGRTCA